MTDDRLKKLEEKRMKINAEIQRIKAKHVKEERKKDTRRKIIIGSMVLKMVKDGEFEEERLRRRLDGFVTREHDRKLFDL